MSISSWFNWVDIDIDSEVTFNGDLIPVAGTATIQFYDDENWVVDSFDGTVFNSDTEEDSIVHLNYRNNHNDPFFIRLREYIGEHYDDAIQAAIREYAGSAGSIRYERHAD